MSYGLHSLSESCNFFFRRLGCGLQQLLCLYSLFHISNVLNCLSRSRAQIPPGTVCRWCFLTEHPWWIRVPRVLCSCFLLCTQERPRPLLTATELRAGSSPEGSRALLGRRGSFFNILLKYSSRIRTAKKSPGCHVPCHNTVSWADLQCFFARVVPWELLGVQFWALSRSLCEQRGVSSACLKEPTSGEPCGWACPSPSS